MFTIIFTFRNTNILPIHQTEKVVLKRRKSGSVTNTENSDTEMPEGEEQRSDINNAGAVAPSTNNDNNTNNNLSKLQNNNSGSSKEAKEKEKENNELESNKSVAGDGKGKTYRQVRALNL